MIMSLIRKTKITSPATLILPPIFVKIIKLSNFADRRPMITYPMIDDDR
jgi:hypothetical protein